jgi:hypothetical protein
VVGRIKFSTEDSYLSLLGQPGDTAKKQAFQIVQIDTVFLRLFHRGFDRTPKKSSDI